jgi:hypothetical protein
VIGKGVTNAAVDDVRVRGYDWVRDRRVRVIGSYLRRVLIRLGRRCGGSVYAAFLPRGEFVPDAAATFLEDVWRTAPWWVTAGNVLGVFVLCLSPPLVMRRLACFPSLSPAEKEEFLRRFARIELYPARLLFAGVKGMALVAILRDEHLRRKLTTSE